MPKRLQEVDNVADELKPIKKDAAGYDVITDAMKDLLNQFPGLKPGEVIKYGELSSDYGTAFFNNSGALVINEKEDITGRVNQECQYPFFVVYRSSGSSKELHKLEIQEFLDSLGKWLCREDTIVDGETHKLESYPKLSGTRQIKKIIRDNSYDTDPQENGVQDWLLPVSVEYDNNFEP